MRQEHLHMPSDEDGLMLHGLLQLPQGEVRGILHLVHGTCDHKERYQQMLDFFSEQGYAVVIFDLRGHGESVRDRDDLGYFYDASGVWLVRDIHQVVHRMKERFGDVPYFLFGHSMGSLAVRCYVRHYDYEVDGVMLCGTPCANPLVPLAMMLCALMRRFQGDHAHSRLFHALTLGPYEKAFPQGRHAWISSMEDAVKAYEADPLCSFTFTLNGYQNLFALMYDAYDEEGWLCRQPDLPFFFVAGEEDPVIGSSQAWTRSMQRLKKSGYARIVKKAYPHARHELFHERCAQEMMQDLLSWMESMRPWEG